MVSNQPWVICRMFGKTGIRGQGYGKENYAGPIVSRSEIYRCNGGRPTGDSDLLDTLRANLDHCVGMAANMIGVKKNIIVVAAGPFQFAMVNPVITKKTGAFQTEEGCLSLEGVRPCTRYKEIEVDFLDADFKKQHGKYSGWTAQIIQHEIDHCNGVVI